LQRLNKHLVTVASQLQKINKEVALFGCEKGASRQGGLNRFHLVGFASNPKEHS